MRLTAERDGEMRKKAHYDIYGRFVGGRPDYRYNIYELKRGPFGDIVRSERLAQVWAPNKREAIVRFLDAVMKTGDQAEGKA